MDSKDGAVYNAGPSHVPVALIITGTGRFSWTKKNQAASCTRFVAAGFIVNQPFGYMELNLEFVIVVSNPTGETT